MNCESYQNLLSDLIDGSLNSQDQNNVETHLSACAVCAEAHADLGALVGFCRDHRGEYEAVPNERALWLRVSNTIESELAGQKAAAVPAGAGWWFRLMNRSWQLSFPQLATAIAATIVLAVLMTFTGTRVFNGSGANRIAGLGTTPETAT